jgi:tRNA nucleotidyltransferase (CCA-adding enzyme)
MCDRPDEAPTAHAGGDVRRTAASGAGVLERLRDQPGGAALLAAANAPPLAGRARAHLVGGSVRDLLRGVAPRELDVVVEGQLEALLDALGGERMLHERFGTASVSLDGARIDVAASRRERYPCPGALPEVEPAPLAEDLLRRDFTVNAIAVSLAGGEMRSAPHAIEDLAATRLRVLHARSFLDDPTRLLRLARYAARLGFSVQERTAALAREALAADALATVSGARIGAELRLALSEEDPIAALACMDRLGVLRAIDPRLHAAGRWEGRLRSALAALPSDGRPELLLLVWLAFLAQDEARALFDRLEVGAAERDQAIAGAARVQALARTLSEQPAPSSVCAAAQGAPAETVALAAVIGGRGASRRGDPQEVARRWFDEWRHMRLEITGDDLIRAGVPRGPEIGERLRAALDRRLDGELPGGRDAELRAALDAQVNAP